MLLACSDVSQSPGQIFKRLLRTPCVEARASKQAEVTGKKNSHSGSGERFEPFYRQSETLRRVVEFRERKPPENSCNGVGQRESAFVRDGQRRVRELQHALRLAAELTD